MRWSTPQLLVAVLAVVLAGAVARVCRSVDARNRAEALLKLRGCTVVEGFVQVLLVGLPPAGGGRGRLSFPELVEVTDYLLVYRARGLRSLGALFPNLAVVRGRALFYDFALVVFGNPDLVQVGLNSLTTIVRGAVNIYKNKNLCYVDTVDWSRLGRGKHHFGRNQDAEACAARQRCDHCKDGRCWGDDGEDGGGGSCQRTPPAGCHAECLGGCRGAGPRDCVACRRFELDGACVDRCPEHRYAYMGRRCVTAEECRSIPNLEISQLKECELEPSKDKRWIPYAGACSQDCPADHQPLGDSCEPCRGHCQVFCGGGEVVDVRSLACAQSLRGCNYLNGSLVVRLQSDDDDGAVARELEESLSSVEEIDGYLEVSRAAPLVSLRFLRRLRRIHGRRLEGGTSALVVRNNPNLQLLFPWDQMTGLEIRAGRLKFHDNPLLCLAEVDRLQKFAGLTNYTFVEVSAESNGNENICKTFSLDAEYFVVNSTCVEISWNAVEQLKRLTLLGFTIHYVEANNLNVSVNDIRDNFCGEDGWKVEYVITHSDKPLPEKIYHRVFNLKPYTRYAFFVKTYTIAQEVEKGLSPFLYFRTHPDRPTVPRSVAVLNSTSSEITLSWKPPLYHNGNLTHYIILGKLYLDSETSVIDRDFCNHPVDVKKHSGTQKVSATSSNKSSNFCCEKNNYGLDIPFSQLDYIIQKVTKKDDMNEQSIYSFLYSNDIFREQGGFINHYGLGGPLFNKTVETYFKSEHPPKFANIDDTVEVKMAGVLVYFMKRVSASSSLTTIKNLAHYGEYSMKIVACRKSYFNESDDNWFHVRCSPTSLMHSRTKPLETADDINSTSIRVKNMNGKDFLSWDSPPNPNGIIVKYDISYGLANDEHFPNFMCLPHFEFNQSGRSIELPNLIPGRYHVRVRATSLAGPGKFTSPVFFRVVSTAADPNMVIVIACIIFAVAIVTVLGAYIWHALQSERQRQRSLYTFANPDYVSLSAYVEDEWEVARDKVELLKELSHGSFGMVYEGILRPANVRCAVKTVNDKATVHQRLEFLNEASVMKAFTEAHHVVKLLGVVSKGQPPLVIMELMGNGDLKTYLRSARDDVDRVPTTRITVKMAAEIADGMAYLEANKFVHRDLAARNCMVTDDLTVKIGDFGMTRDIYENDYYRKESKGLVPVRWMAPESLGDGVFTSKSDVWSYGVVLWEIITLAEQPYQGLSNEEVLQFVVAGGCLDHPAGCPGFLRHLMACCWRRSPNHRPTFLQVLDCFESGGARLDDDFRRVSFYHGEAGLQLRSGQDFRAHEEELVSLLGDVGSPGSGGEYFLS
ncbi:insulin receptor-like [Bacillus rossius redtenbacheri]|uniref:insulin receptor-like n=1 Tax=Bacillus rossius redtenbacheri TaxID=93214 RepID=UPI002FDDF82A